MSNRTAPPLGTPPTVTQVRILSWLADGLTVPEIAETHHYSQWTIKTHMYRVHKQLGSRTAAQAVAIAYAKGLLPFTETERPK